MADINFLRTYTLKCGRAGSNGFEIGNVHNAVDPALHVSFSVEKCDVESPNTAKVQIWNLSDNNLKILDGKDCVVELKAGYDGSNALILVGNVTSVVTVPENADRMTEIEVMDGRVELRETAVTLSLNGSVNCKDIYKQIASKMGLSIVFAGDLWFKTMPDGFSFVGKAKNALQKISGYCGHCWTIQNHVIQITWPGRAVNTRCYVLSSDTGLISIPKRITISSSPDNQESLTGWEVEYLLNGAIGVNDAVLIRSSTANGYYRVHKVTFDGDNIEGDWICTAQLLEIKAQPKLDVKANTTKKASVSAKPSVAAPPAETPVVKTGIKKGDKVKVIRTFRQGALTKGYVYGGGTFVCYYPVYDVIQVNGERAVIGIGRIVTAAINVNDLEKV